MTTPDTQASASFDFESEEREEIADVPAPTPAPTLETVEEQYSHSRIQKVNKKELWKASQFI